MTTLMMLLQRMDRIVDEVYGRTNKAEVEREHEFWAAVKVQAWFRAQRVRAYLRYLSSCAVEVQRRWRGYIGRIKYRKNLKETIFKMKLNHYNRMATKIQKVWRGFYARKYIFNYYSRKRYLEGLKVKNDIIRAELEEFSELQEQRHQHVKEELEQKKLQHWAQKHHHLISTEVQPGIFNSPFKPYPDELEYHLRNIQSVAATSTKSKPVFDPTWKRYDSTLKEPLPPLQPKPQGPFKDSQEVRKQRYKSFRPTLRVETSFTALENARRKMKEDEWVTRLNDDIFQPSIKKQYIYEPLLHTSTKYEDLPYGNKHFRDEYIDKFVIQKGFQTVVPPIPLFDKFQDTYAQ